MGGFFILIIAKSSITTRLYMRFVVTLVLLLVEVDQIEGGSCPYLENLNCRGVSPDQTVV
jgi:hypothetical protein